MDVAFISQRDGVTVIDAVSGEIIAVARNREAAQRIVAALNAFEGAIRS